MQRRCNTDAGIIANDVLRLALQGEGIQALRRRRVRADIRIGHLELYSPSKEGIENFKRIRATQKSTHIQYVDIDNGLESIIDWAVNDDIPVMVVKGPRGSGKTRLVSEVVDYLLNHGWNGGLWFDEADELDLSQTDEKTIVCIDTNAFAATGLMDIAHRLTSEQANFRIIVVDTSESGGLSQWITNYLTAPDVDLDFSVFKLETRDFNPYEFAASAADAFSKLFATPTPSPSTDYATGKTPFEIIAIELARSLGYKCDSAQEAAIAIVKCDAARLALSLPTCSEEQIFDILSAYDALRKDTTESEAAKIIQTITGQDVELIRSVIEEKAFKGPFGPAELVATEFFRKYPDLTGELLTAGNEPTQIALCISLGLSAKQFELARDILRNHFYANFSLETMRAGLLALAYVGQPLGELIEAPLQAKTLDHQDLAEVLGFLDACHLPGTTDGITLAVLRQAIDASSDQPEDLQILLEQEAALLNYGGKRMEAAAASQRRLRLARDQYSIDDDYCALSKALIEHAQLLTWTGEYVATELCLHEAFDLLESHPGDSEVFILRAAALQVQADVQLLETRPDESSASAHEAATIYRAAGAVDDTYNLALAEALYAEAQALRQIGSPRAAFMSAAEAHSQAQELRFIGETTDFGVCRYASLSARILAEGDRFDDALPLYESIVDTLDAQPTFDINAQLVLTDALRQLVTIYGAQNKSQQALNAARSAVDQCRLAVAHDPANETLLIDDLCTLAGLLYRADAVKEAIEFQTEAVELDAGSELGEGAVALRSARKATLLEWQRRLAS